MWHQIKQDSDARITAFGSAGIALVMMGLAVLSATKGVALASPMMMPSPAFFMLLAAMVAGMGLIVVLGELKEAVADAADGNGATSFQASAFCEGMHCATES